MPPGSAWTPSGPDGISALPDDVIHLVIGFLPAHEALQMSTLARSWRNHWMWMHSLRFSVSASVSVVVLKRLVGRLLLDIRAPLDECIINIQGVPKLTEDVGLLIRHAVSECNVRILKVNFSRQVISCQPLVSGHLVRLELHHITVEDTILDFSSCTALEDIVISRADIRATKISSPSLKRLRIVETCCLFPSDSATCISAPSIVSMELDDLCVTTPLFERMPLLETTFVRLGYGWAFYCKAHPTQHGCCGVCVGCIEFYLMELGSLSSARHLELTAPSVKFTVVRCPTFSKLTTLLLNEWCLSADFGALSCILQHSPILEKLTLILKKVPSEIYHAMEQLPAISKCLKVVDIKCKKVDDRLYDFLKILKKFLGREHLRYNLTSRGTEIPLEV